MTLLSTDGLTKQFGELAAVDTVDYYIDEGEIASIIGPNGAGKTTFFNLITGEYEVTSGSITFKGEEVTHLKPHQRVKRGMGRVFQISNIFPGLTTFENVRLALQSRELETSRELVAEAYENQEIIDEAYELLEDLELSDNRELEAANLSHGAKRRLEIGMALALDPDLLLMDEPTAGLADEEVREITAFIDEISADYTILLVEHKMDVVMGLSDRISVLHQGKLVADDTVEGIKNNERVQEIYLGEEGQYA
jgi:branched-chain amino acid transport system ATP-binding protein